MREASNVRPCRTINRQSDETQSRLPDAFAISVMAHIALLATGMAPECVALAISGTIASTAVRTGRRYIPCVIQTYFMFDARDAILGHVAHQGKEALLHRGVLNLTVVMSICSL